MRSPLSHMRHHYIPQWLLRNFRDSHGKIYGFVKSNAAGGVFVTTPKKLMVENDLYTLFGKSGTERQAAEEWFARHEAHAKDVADKIISAVRNDALPRLTPEEKSICHQFHCTTWVRTPDIAAEQDEAFGPFDNDAFLEWCAQECKWGAHDMAIARDFLNNPDNARMTKHDSHVMGVAAPPTPNVIKELEVRGLRIARIAKSSKSFVIGSYALALAKYRGESHAWLPLSHDVAVEPYGPAGTETLVELDQDHIVRSINEASFRHSSIVAARSEKLLRSLADGLGYAL